MRLLWILFILLALNGCAVNQYGVVIPLGTDCSIDPQACK